MAIRPCDTREGHVSNDPDYNHPYQALDMCPEVGVRGNLNCYYSKMRTLGNQYLVDGDYANYIFGMRACYAAPGLITESAEIKQSFFQPLSRLPSEKLCDEMKYNMVKYGIDPIKSYIQYEFEGYREKIPTWVVDCMVHFLLGAVNVRDLHHYKFESPEEIDRMREGNLEKAESLDRRWGDLFWNIQYPPMPRKYRNKRGEYLADKPTWADYNCQLYREFCRRGICVKPSEMEKNGRTCTWKIPATKKTKKKGPVKNSLFRFGFKPSNTKANKIRKAKKKTSGSQMETDI